MSSKEKGRNMEAMRVVMTPLGSAASNVFNMLNMSFFLVFSTEALGLNVMLMGIVMTVMRIFDGITDPIIGSIIDRTETRFGKFRPFLVIGSLIMLFASFMIYLFSFDIGQSFRMVWGDWMVCSMGSWIYFYDNGKQMCLIHCYKKSKIPSAFRYCRWMLFHNAWTCYDNWNHSNFTEKWWS